MRPDPFFSDLPNREDLGIDESYEACRAFRGLGYALLFSAPIWAAIAIAIYFFTH